MDLKCGLVLLLIGLTWADNDNLRHPGSKKNKALTTFYLKIMAKAFISHNSIAMLP
jgi:hypothetical protein